MNPFLSDDEPLSIPSISAYQRAIAAFEGGLRTGEAQSWLTVRSREDVLVDAKAVDERVRAGEDLPLAGALVAVPDNPLIVQRLAREGAVVLGRVGDSLPPGDIALGMVDAAACHSLPTSCRDVVALRPTRGLVPGLGEVTVLARDVSVGQRAAAAMTGPDESDPAGRDWPASVRFSAGEHPRVAVPSDSVLGRLSREAYQAFHATAATLHAAGAVVETIDLPTVMRSWIARPATLLRGHDALLLPVAGTEPALADLVSALDAAAVALPDSGPLGVGVLTRAFDDQVAIDVAALLSGIQADTPYPATGAELVVSGAYLRGQPLNEQLTRLGARFTGFVETAPRYRMLALPGDPPQPGIVRVAEGGASLVAERWLISTAGLGRFLADLPAPMLLGSVELDDGATATGVLCDPAAAREGTDISEFGCWRAYLRFLSTRRPNAAPGRG